MGVLSPLASEGGRRGDSSVRGEIAERDSPAVAASCGPSWMEDAPSWIERSCCWICGNRDHWSDQCPDNCCWSCGDRDRWSYRCPRTGVRSVEVNIAGMKIYDSLVEAMIDNTFKDARGAGSITSPERVAASCRRG